MINIACRRLLKKKIKLKIIKVVYCSNPGVKKMTFIIQKLFPFHLIDKHLSENTVTKANRQ